MMTGTQKRWNGNLYTQTGQDATRVAEGELCQGEILWVEYYRGWRVVDGPVPIEEARPKRRTLTQHTDGATVRYSKDGSTCVDHYVGLFLPEGKNLEFMRKNY